MTTLSSFLDARSASAPGTTALIDRDATLTVADLAGASARLAGGLKSIGIGRGDRVAIWLPDLPAWLATFFACARLGAIAVAVNTRFRSGELADIVGRSGCKAIVFWPGFRDIDFAGILDEADAAAFGALTHAIAYDEGEAHAAPQVHGRPVLAYRSLIEAAPLAADEGSPGAGCVIFTTSGTTRAPKFVMHDQRTLLAHGRDVARDFGYVAPGACVLVSAPLCGVFGFVNALAALVAAAPVVMDPVFDGAAAARAVRRYRVTHTHASDEMISRMLDAALEADRLEAARAAPTPAGADPAPVFPSVRFFGYARFTPGHAELPERAAACGLALAGLYGMSEVQALCARQDPAGPLEQRVLGGGRLVAPEGRVRARDPVTGEILAHGEAGELELAVPSRMVGYFGDPQATRAAFTDDGFLRTGDLGYTTGERSFVFLARIGDTLRLGGFLVSPAEIEATLLAHPGVAAAQVVGVDTSAGPRAFAFVIPAPGVSFDELALIAHCAGRIAKYKVPVRVRPIDAFPVTPSANATKIQKSKLREIASASIAAGETGASSGSQ